MHLFPVLVWVRVSLGGEQGSSGKTIVVENPMSLDENGKLVSGMGSALR